MYRRIEVLYRAGDYSQWEGCGPWVPESAVHLWDDLLDPTREARRLREQAPESSFQFAFTEDGWYEFGLLMARAIEEDGQEVRIVIATGGTVVYDDGSQVIICDAQWM